MAEIRFSESPLFPISCERMTGFPISLSPKGPLLLAQESPLGRTTEEKGKREISRISIWQISVSEVWKGGRGRGVSLVAKTGGRSDGSFSWVVQRGRRAWKPLLRLPPFSRTNFERDMPRFFLQTQVVNYTDFLFPPFLGRVRHSRKRVKTCPRHLTYTHLLFPLHISSSRPIPIISELFPSSLFSFERKRDIASAW